MKTHEIAILEDSEIEEASEYTLQAALRYLHTESKLLEEIQQKVRKKLAPMNKAAWEASKSK